MTCKGTLIQKSYPLDKVESRKRGPRSVVNVRIKQASIVTLIITNTMWAVLYIWLPFRSISEGCRTILEVTLKD